MAETQESLLQQIKEQGDLVRKLKTAKESSEKAKGYNGCSMELKQLDMHFSKFSYVRGFIPTQCDIHMIQSLGKQPHLKKYPYLKRWWHHMRSFSDSEISIFPFTNKGADAFYEINFFDYEHKVGDIV